MDERETILLENLDEYFNAGLEELEKRKFTTAATLFFKAIAVLCDLQILRKEGFIPSSHTHRFRVLEEKYPDLYKIIDRDFPFYQDSYTQKIDEETSTLLKDDAETIKKILGI